MKFNRHSIRLLVSIIVIFTVGHAYGEQQWWEKSNEGWFFYNEKPVIEEPEATPVLPSPTSPDMNQKQPTYGEAMRQKGEELMSAAMDHPTVENVRAVMEHNAEMLDRSAAFATAWQKVLMMYPQLASAYPMNDNDRDITFREEGKEKSALMEQLSEKAGLFFIYESTCPYCEREAKHLADFKRRFPTFTVKAVTMDGGMFPEFPDSVYDNGIAERLGVTRLPAIFLAFPPDRFERISEGIISSIDLENKLLWYMQDLPEFDKQAGASIPEEVGDEK